MIIYWIIRQKVNYFNDRNIIIFILKNINIIGCLLNLKENIPGGGAKRESNVSSSSRYIGNLGGNDIEIKLEVKKFLTTDRNIKLYII